MIVYIKEGESEYGLICTASSPDSDEFDVNNFHFWVLNGCWNGEYYDGMFSVDRTDVIRENCSATIDESEFPEWTKEYVVKAKAKQRHYEKHGTLRDVESVDLFDDYAF